jgi:hypothetical protein
MKAFFGHRDHLVRMAVLFLVGIGVFLALKAIFTPAGFGLYGHYRAGALDENRARPAVYGGRTACVECHSDVPETAKGGRHAGIRCEACHGPLAAHAADPGEHQAVRPDSKVLCVRCHAPNVARPARFPQVDAKEHAGEEACTTCHAAHQPGQSKEAAK